MFECEKENNAVAAAVRYGMIVNNVSPKQMADAMRKDLSTFYNRMKRPETFTLDELRRASAKIHIPLEKLVKGETQ